MVDRDYIGNAKLTSNKAMNSSLNDIYSSYKRTACNSTKGSFGNAMSISMNLSSINKSSDNASIANSKKIASSSVPDSAIRRRSKVEYVVKAASHTGNGQAVDEAVVSDSLKVLSSDVKAIVCEVLDLTDAELDRLLAEYGMCISDLFIPNNLAAFVANSAADGDTMKLLTDGGISQMYSEIGGRLEELLSAVSESMNITEDELTMLLADYDILQQQDNRNQSNESGALNTADKKLLSEMQEIASVIQETSQQTADSIELQTNASKEKMGSQSDKDNQSLLSGQEKGTLAGQFVDNLIRNFDNSLNTNNVFNGYTVDTEDVMRQLIDSIKVNVTGQTSEMELQLSPESLGKVNLLVEVRNGIVTAQLTTQNEAVKSIIENQLVSLKESFEQQGLKVEAVEVMVESHGFEAGKNFEGRSDGNTAKEKHGSTRHLTLDEIDARLSEEDSISEEELLAAEMMRAMGGSVDYTA